MDNLSYNISTNKRSDGFLKSIFARRNEEAGLTQEKEAQEYLDSLVCAKQDLETIEKLFNSTVDPDLIEYAICQENALKVKLSYLIKKAKEKNIKSLNFTVI
jgi:hypothetical protein